MPKLKRTTELINFNKDMIDSEPVLVVFPLQTRLHLNLQWFPPQSKNNAYFWNLQGDEFQYIHYFLSHQLALHSFCFFLQQSLLGHCVGIFCQGSVCFSCLRVLAPEFSIWKSPLWLPKLFSLLSSLLTDVSSSLASQTPWQKGHSFPTHH